MSKSKSRRTSVKNGSPGSRQKDGKSYRLRINLSSEEDEAIVADYTTSQSRAAILLDSRDSGMTPTGNENVAYIIVRATEEQIKTIREIDPSIAGDILSRRAKSNLGDIDPPTRRVDTGGTKKAKTGVNLTVSIRVDSLDDYNLIADYLSPETRYACLLRLAGDESRDKLFSPRIDREGRQGRRRYEGEMYTISLRLPDKKSRLAIQDNSSAYERGAVLLELAKLNSGGGSDEKLAS